jgi:protein-S-isoprenylcysteine O-methyltransferase Ste14
MQAFYRYAISAMWLLWLLYWIAAALHAKPVRARESTASRLSHMVPLALGVVLFLANRLPIPWLNERFLPRGIGWFWLAFWLTALGLAFSVAARVWLGGNWSGTVTLKHNHELIRTGPYGWVRHPIYTGLLLALLGSALVNGEWRGLLALALITAAILRRIRIEEAFLARQFGAAYRRYREAVPSLLPLPRRRAL